MNLPSEKVSNLSNWVNVIKIMGGIILNKFIIDTNIKNYLVKTSIYQIPGYKIIKIDKYYILINKNNYLSDDLLTTTNFSNKIPLTNFIQNINDIYLGTPSNYKKNKDKLSP